MSGARPREPRLRLRDSTFSHPSSLTPTGLLVWLDRPGDDADQQDREADPDEDPDLVRHGCAGDGETEGRHERDDRRRRQMDALSLVTATALDGGRRCLVLQLPLPQFIAAVN